MSPLAFDKQGKPFAWHSRTRKLKVRLFRNPAARGTCCQVLDGAGAPLYVDAETDYAEFRRAIGNVPGFYRLDQCDDDCVEIEGAAPAYVSIEHLRNAQPADGGASSNDVNPLVIIQSMAAIQADVMKTMAAQQAALMAATAEIMRAPYRPALVAPADHRNAYDEEDDDELEDEEEVTASNEILGMLGPLLPKIGEKFGEQLGQRVIDAVLGVFGRKPDAQAAAPAATPAPMPMSHPAPAPTERHAHGSQVGIAAGQGLMPVPLHVQVVAGDDVVTYEATDYDGNAVEGATPGMFAPIASAAMSGSTAQWPATTLVPNAPNSEPAMPTPEPMAHLLAIRESLTPTERTLSARVIARMAPDIQAQWLGALATKSIEDAATEIRAVLAQLQNSKQR